ncbi:hypothetical protein FOZ63_016155, partial [Perkinsus olseni]
DSIHNVLKVELEVMPTWCTRKGASRGVLKPGMLVWFGEAEAGMVIESRGQEVLLHMMKINRKFNREFEVKSLYFDERSGSIWAYPYDHNGLPSAGEGIPSDRKPLLRSRSFDPRDDGKNWRVLNVKRKTGCLTYRSTKWIEDWIGEDNLCACRDVTRKDLHACTSPPLAVSVVQLVDGIYYGSEVVSVSAKRLYVEDVEPSEAT